MSTTPQPTDEPGAVTPPAPPSDARADDDRRESRLTTLVFPLLLAALGLAGAMVAWRVAVASDAAGGASAAGITAARARATAVVGHEARIATALDGWLEHERARRRAEALEAAGYPRTALRDRTEAAGNFFLLGTDVQYLDAEGQFDPQRMREALLAEASSREDLDPAPHFAAADAEYARVRGLIWAGVVIAAALPLLTLAEVTRGRLRAISALLGTGLFAVGLVLGALLWI